MTLKKTLAEWAESLRKKAEEKDTPLQESIDAFKAVTAYYAVELKQRKKSGDDEEPDDGGFTFGEAGHGGGSQKIPSRRNS